MPRKKTINKTLEVWLYLKRYGAIDRRQAENKFEAFNLPQVMARVKLRALKAGFGVIVVETGNTKYKLIEIEKL